MRRSTILTFGVAAATVAAASFVVPAAMASGHDDALEEVRSATRQYRKVERPSTPDTSSSSAACTSRSPDRWGSTSSTARSPAIRPSTSPLPRR